MTNALTNKRPSYTQLVERPAKRICLEMEAKMASLPLLIQEMNAILTQQIANQEKVMLLTKRLRDFCASRTGPLFGNNPIYGRELREIAHRCLQLAPDNEDFQSMQALAEATSLPPELMLNIVQSAPDQLEEMIEKRGEHNNSLLSRMGRVSKLWRQALLAVFAKKLTPFSVGQLNIYDAEDVIQLAQICGCHFDRLILANEMGEIPFTEEQIGRLSQLSFENLKSLSLASCRLTQLGALVDCNAPKLRTLNLSGNYLDSREIARLSSGQLRNTVEKLILTIVGSCREDLDGETLYIDPASVQVLLDGFPKLRKFYIDTPLGKGLWGGLGLQGALALANAPQSTKLQTLSLDYSSLGDRGVCTLLSSVYLTNLRGLSFSYNEMGSEGLQAFGHCTFRHLTALSLDGNTFDQEGLAMRSFTENSSLSNLEGLSFYDCTFDGECQNWIARARVFTRLKALSLADTDWFNAPLIQLSRNDHYANLEFLNVELNNDLVPETYLQVAESPTLRNLAELIYGEETDDDFTQRIELALSKKRLGPMNVAEEAMEIV